MEGGQTLESRLESPARGRSFPPNCRRGRGQKRAKSRKERRSEEAFGEIKGIRYQGIGTSTLQPPRPKDGDNQPQAEERGDAEAHQAEQGQAVDHRAGAGLDELGGADDEGGHHQGEGDAVAGAVELLLQASELAEIGRASCRERVLRLV